MVRQLKVCPNFDIFEKKFLFFRNIIFSSFLNRKFISRLRFEDMEDLKINMAAQLHTIFKEDF